MDLRAQREELGAQHETDVKALAAAEALTTTLKAEISQLESRLAQTETQMEKAKHAEKVLKAEVADLKKQVPQAKGIMGSVKSSPAPPPDEMKAYAEELAKQLEEKKKANKEVSSAAPCCRPTLMWCWGWGGVRMT